MGQQPLLHTSLLLHAVFVSYTAGAKMEGPVRNCIRATLGESDWYHGPFMLVESCADLGDDLAALVCDLGGARRQQLLYSRDEARREDIVQHSGFLVEDR